VEKLYSQAIGDLKQKFAFAAYKDTLRTHSFSKVCLFIVQELERHRELCKVLEVPRKFAAPRQLSEWDKIWTGSLRELAGTIEAQLRSAAENLVKQLGWLRSGRTKIESHLLCSTYTSIVELRKRERLRISSYGLLVAYAHASQLVPYKNLVADGEPVGAMKMRLSRAKHSQKRVDVLCRLLLNSLPRGEKVLGLIFQWLMR
jgi:hypothetical protein